MRRGFQISSVNRFRVADPYAACIQLVPMLCAIGAAWLAGAMPDAAAQIVPAHAVGSEFVASATVPVFVTYAPGDDDHLFVVEQAGRIRVLDLNTNQYLGAPLLDVRGQIIYGGEQGLLGLAFHPDWQNNRQFFIYTSDPPYAGGQNHASYVRRYEVTDVSAPVADIGTETTILRFGQPQTNHNAGWIGFGTHDDYLYIATGDGGGGNDSATGHTPGTGNAQDITDNLLGKILRIDVGGDDFAADPNANYAIPASNPFVGVTGDDEIWAYGLRNPWRDSFDRVTGDLWIADVGQNYWEEIDFQPADSAGGENYGWRLREGLHETPTGGVGGPRPPGNVDPIHEYSHSDGNAVTGGYVYRGFVEALYGRYLFADYGAARIWSFRYDGQNKTDFQEITSELTPNGHTFRSISSFGEDARGNVYLVELSGGIYRITGDPIAGDFDLDGDVDGDDFLLWQSNFGGAGPAGDADQDGDVDGDDFLLWQSHFGTRLEDGSGAAGGKMIPEPAALAIVCSALVAAAGSRHRVGPSGRLPAKVDLLP